MDACYTAKVTTFNVIAVEATLAGRIAHAAMMAGSHR
jgi:hypothetical protein